MRLRHQLFLLLLLSGIVPLAISSTLLLRQNRELLETQEKSYLTRSASFLSVELDNYLSSSRDQLEQLGIAVLATPGGAVDAKLRAPWLNDYLERFLRGHGDLVAIRLLDASGVGPQFTVSPLDAGVARMLAGAFDEARAGSEVVYRLVVREESNQPLVVLAVPVLAGDRPVLFVEAVSRLERMEALFSDEAQGDVSVFLVDGGGRVLWSEGADEIATRALETSRLVRDFVGHPLNLTAEYELAGSGRAQRMLGRISPVAETGWGVVLQKPLAGAFGAVRRMFFNTLLSTALLVGLALVAAAVAARRISRPIQKLAETSHEIVAGNFGKRVETAGLGGEMGELAADFNRMSDHVQEYVQELERAAATNREIFIGSMRAFVAAVDAKDPYTRGHSERVAAHSRTIAKFLGRDEDFQQKVWVGALLHDVGKIGIDDAILKKGGVLTADEYERMKQHPVIGAEIMSRIELLRDMLPAIRWHHEAWNGKGYPDGLKGDQIPLMARIVGVADTFDAITTNRPYQRAYDSDFAVETIRKLTGARFDAKIVTAFLLAFEAGEVRLRTSASAPAAAAASA